MSKRKRFSPEYKNELVELVRRTNSSCRKVALEVGFNGGFVVGVLGHDDGGAEGFLHNDGVVARDDLQALSLR